MSLAWLVGVLVAIPLAACASGAHREITKERAIEIARSHASFEVTSVEAVEATEDGRRVWRVTLRGDPGKPLGEYMVVTIDRATGEVVAIAMS